MKSIVGLIILILAGTCSFAQMQQIARYEHPKEDQDDYFSVIGCGEYGLMLLEEDHIRGKVEQWILTGLDTALSKRWTLTLGIDFQFDFRGYEVLNENIFLVFEESNRSKANYRIVQINVMKGTMVTFEVFNELAFELTNLIAVRDRLILAGYVRYSPTLMSYKMGDNAFTIVPGFFKDRSDIIDLRVNDSNTYNILTSETSYSGPFLRLKTYSYDSEILFERTIEMEEDKEVLDGTSLGFVDGNMALVGTYGARNSKYIQGMYFALIKPTGQDNFIKYNDLSEFRNFFAYTDNEKREARLTQKAEQLSNRGKEMKVGVRLFMHDVIPLDKSFLLVADVYDVKFDTDSRTRYLTQPQYSMYDIRSLPRGRYSFMDDPSQRLRDATVRYDYLSAIAIDMDARGNVLWDNSIIVEEKESYILDNLVDAYAGPDSVYLSYKFEEELVYKGIPYSSESVDARYVPVQLENPDDDLRNSSEEIGEMKYWYQNNFFVWGYHKINDRSVRGSEGRRKVIYINKVNFPDRSSPTLLK